MIKLANLNDDRDNVFVIVKVTKLDIFYLFYRLQNVVTKDMKRDTKNKLNLKKRKNSNITRLKILQSPYPREML